MLRFIIRHTLDLLLGNAGDAGHRCGIVVEVRDLIADNHLKPSRLREGSPFYGSFAAKIRATSTVVMTPIR